jgi:hypothetical protein
MKGGLPWTARLEVFAHGTDTGRYLDGAVDVAHVGEGEDGDRERAG